MLAYKESGCALRHKLVCPMCEFRHICRRDYVTASIYVWSFSPYDTSGKPSLAVLGLSIAYDTEAAHDAVRFGAQAARGRELRARLRIARFAEAAVANPENCAARSIRLVSGIARCVSLLCACGAPKHDMR